MATNKVSVKLSGVAATMKGATAAKNLNGGKTDKISKTGKAKTNNKKSSGSAAATPVNTAEVDTSGAGNKDILLQWKGVQFFANASKIVGFNDLKINASCETEDTEDSGEKYVSLKNKKGFEVSFKAYLDKRLGVDDVRSDAVALANYAAAGNAGYIYCCGEKLVPANMMATSGKISDVRMTPAGTWISCEVQMTFKSCGKLEGVSGGGPSAAGASGGGSSSGGSYTATVNYSGSSGVVSSVTATSTVSYADALKKAYAKVPKNALWANEDKSKATTNQKINTAVKQQKDAKTQSSSSGGLFSQIGELTKYKQSTSKNTSKSKK